MELSVNPEYEKIMPKLSSSQYGILKHSIECNNLFLPITVNKDGVVLDGHHRLKACRELGFEPKYEVKQLSSVLEEKVFVVKVNLERRQLTDLEKAELGLILLPFEEELAKLRQGTRTDLKETSGSFEPEVTRARDNIAKEIGLSPTTFERAKAIIEKGSDELKEKVKSGTMSITYAYKSLKNKERHSNQPTMPEGVFNVIYADPPWKYDLELRGSPDMHYQTMTLEEICNLKVPASDDAILFLWSPNPKLEDALKVVEAWGFSYKTNMVWVKDKFGTGYYFRGQHELLLVATKGKIPVPEEENRASSVLHAGRREHSQKPDEVYNIIESMYPTQKYLELFARNKRLRWTSWGNDLGKV